MTKEWFTAPELAAMALPGLSKDRTVVLRQARRDGWHDRRLFCGQPGARKRAGSKAIEFHFTTLPGSAWRELARRGFFESNTDALDERNTGDEALDDIKALWSRFAGLTRAQKAVAEDRLKALQHYSKLRTQLGFSASEAKTKTVLSFKDQMKISGSSLSRWLAAVRGVSESDWLPLLVNSHGGGAAKAELHDEDWSYFLGLYLTPLKRPVTSCYEMMQAFALERDRVVPALRTIRRRVKSLDPDMVILKREGREAFKAAAPAQRRTRSHFEAMQHLNGDGHKWDVMVEWEDGSVSRPMMVAYQDLYSGKFVGWRLGKTEDTELVRLALHDTLSRHGVPQVITVDNGRAFAAKDLTGGAKHRFRGKTTPGELHGLLTQLGVDVRFTKPYSGQSKPIERAFRDFCDRIAKHPLCEGAYVGNNPLNKPENAGTNAVPISTFRAIVNEGIEAENAREGRRSAVCKGRSFNEAFEVSLADRLVPIQHANAIQLMAFLYAGKPQRVDSKRASVWIHGTQYWDAALAAYRGEQVVVRYDPDDLNRPVMVIDAATDRLICEAAPQTIARFDDEKAAKTHAAKERARKKAAVEAYDALSPMPIHEIQKRTRVSGATKSETPDRKVIKGAFPNARTHKKPKPSGLSEAEIDQMFSEGIHRLKSGKKG